MMFNPEHKTYIRNTNTVYGIIAILLHWLMAILIIGLFSLGKYMVDLDYYDQWYHTAPWWHKSIGVCVFTLLLIRLAWKLSNTDPEPLQTYKAWEIKAAKTVHIFFYVLLLIICISGYFISTAKGIGIEAFGWFDIPSVISLSDTQADLAGKVHEIATNALVAMLVLHIIAALKHHYYNKDETLTRMLNPIKPKENIN